jgi:hypothetical protein
MTTMSSLSKTQKNKSRPGRIDPLSKYSSTVIYNPKRIINAMKIFSNVLNPLL